MKLGTVRLVLASGRLEERAGATMKQDSPTPSHPIYPKNEHT